MLKIAIKFYGKHFSEAVKVMLFSFISIIVFITGGTAYQLHNSELSSIAKNLRLAIIVNNELNNNDILILINKISNINGINSAEYTDQEKLREGFLRANKIDTTNVVLDSFPKFILAFPTEDHYQAGKLSHILNKIRSIDGVDDIAYDKAAFEAYHKFRKESNFTGLVIFCIIFSLMLFYGFSIYFGQKSIYQHNFVVLFQLGFSKWSSVSALIIYEFICLLIGLTLGLTVFLIIWLVFENYFAGIGEMVIKSIPYGILMSSLFSASMILITNIFFKTSRK